MYERKYHKHISARHNWFDLKLNEVWQYRDLIFLFTQKNFTVSYKQTILGPLWLFINPLLTSVMYGCIWKYCETWNGRDSAAFILSERKCIMELFCLLSEWKCGNVYIECTFVRKSVFSETDCSDFQCSL